MVEEADLIIALFDVSEELSEDDKKIIDIVRGGKKKHSVIKQI